MINPYIAGKHVYLRHPTEEDALGKWYEWFSDEETTKYLNDQFWPNNVENQLNLYNSLVDERIRDYRHRLVLSIVTKKDDLHIGVVSLSRINWVHRYADSVIIIGDKSHKRMPYTVEAHELTHAVAFARLNLLNLKSYYAATNEGAIALQELFKYKKVGVYEKLLSVDGARVDLITGMLNKNDYLRLRRK